MMYIDAFSDALDAYAVWDNGTWTVRPEDFASHVATIVLPETVPAEVPSVVEPNITTTDPRIAMWTMDWIMRDFFDHADFGSAVEVQVWGEDADKIAPPSEDSETDVVY